MSCGKYLVVCIVLCYVNIKRTETQSLPRDENPNQRRYRTNDEAISSQRKLKAHNQREGEYYYDPPRYNVRRPNYQDFNPDYREEYQERLLKRRPSDFRETRQYHEKQRAPPIFRNDIPPYQRHEPPQVRHNTLYERHNIPQYEMHDLPPYRHYVPQYQRQEYQNEPQNERFSLPPYERRFVPQYQRHIKAPFSRNQMHHRENIRTDNEASIPSHRRFNRGYHGQQDPPFGKYIKPISMVQAVSVDKESKHTVEKETLEPFEREIKESVLQEEKRPFARSDKFKGDIQKEPDCNRKKLDQFAEDQKRNRYDYPNELRLHRRRQPLMNDYVARYRQPNYYDYDDFYRPRRDQYRQPYENRLKYPNGPSYYQPKQYDVPLWIQGKRNAQYRNYFRSDVNKQATTDNEAKRNGKEENRKIMDKIIENYGKDLRAEREDYENNRMRTDININVVKMTNIDQERTIQFFDSNINENQDLTLHEKEAPTVKYTQGTESVTKKDEENYQDFTILITRRNDQHQDHFTKVKDKKAQYYASAATHGGRTTHSWLMEQYEGIAGQVDQEFEKFLQTQRDKKRKSENGEIPERPQHNLKQSTTTARWFSNVDEKDDSRNSNDSSHQTTDTEKVDERPNRIEKRNSYEDYYENKFKEMPPGPMLGQHVLFRHLQSPQCVQEFTITLPPDFSPPPNWKDSEELKQKTKRAPIILTRGNNNEKEQTVKHPGELNRSEEDWETFAQSYIPEEQSKENEKAQVSKTDPKTNRDKIFDLQEHPHNQDDNFEATYSKSDDDDDDSDGILVNNAGKSSDQSDSQLDKLLDRVDELTLHGGKSLQKNLINKKKEAKKKRKPESFMYTSMEWQEKRNNRPRHARSLGENRTENETNHESIEKGELPNNMVTYDDAFEMYHNPHLIEENKDYSTYYRKRKPEFDNSAEEQYYKRLHKFMRRPISQEIDSGGKRKFRKRRSLRKTKRDIAEIIDNMTKSSINQIVSTTVKKVTTILDHTTDGTTRTTLDFLANFYKAFSKISPTTSSTDISSYVQSKDMRGDLPASNASDIDHSYYDILLERIRNIKKGGDGQLKYGQTVRRSHSRPPESCYIPNDYLRKHGHTLDQFGRVVNLTLPPTTTPRHMKFNDAVALMKRKRDFRRDQFLKRYKDPKVFMQETDEWLAGQTKRPPAILTRGSNEVTARYHSTEPLVIRDIEEQFEPTTDKTLSLNSSEKQPPETTKRRRNVEVFERNLNVYTYEVHCRREPTKNPTMRRKKRAANPISFTRKFFHHVQGGASNDTSESSGQQDSNSMEDSQVNRLEAFLNKFKMNTDLEYVTPEIRVVHNLSSPDPQKIIRSVTRKYDRALQNISMTYDPSFLYHWEALRNSTRAMNNVKINIQYDDEYVKQLLKTKKEREEEAQREKEKNKREKAKRNTIKIMLRKFTGATVKGSKVGNEKAVTETRVTKDANEIENNDNAYGDVMETEDSDEVIGETIHYRLRRSISPLLYDDMPIIPYQFPFFKQQISSSSTSTVTTNHPNYDENLFGSFEIKDRSIPEGDEYQRERDNSGDEHKPSLRISEICPTPRKAQSKSTQHSLILSLERSPRTNTGQQAHGKPTRAKPKLKNDIHYKHTLGQFYIKNHSIHHHLKVTHKDRRNTSQTSTVVDNEAINSNIQDIKPSTRRNETNIKKIKHATKSGNHSKRDSEQALFGSINVNADLDSNAVSQHFSKEEDRAEIRHIMHFLNQTITEPHMTTKHGETLYGRWDDAKWRAQEYERAMKHKAYLEEMHGKPTTWQDLLREKKQFEDMVLRDAANDWKNHPEKFQYFDIPTDDLESVTIGSDETEEDEYTPDTAG